MFTTLKKRLSNYGEFPSRIKNRHDIFWKAADAELIRNQRMWASDDFSKWKNGQHWQRRLSNKANAKEFALKCDCKVADLYWRGRDMDEIKFQALPSHYVIRPTIGHSSRQIFIMADGINLFDKKAYSPEEIRAELKQAVIADLRKEFLVEEFLKDEKGEYGILDDYKFYCFNGEVVAFGVINRLSPSSGFETFYDMDWNELPQISLSYPRPKIDPVKPKCWDEMLEKVKTLSKAYEIFVRLDFYACDKGAVFGEFTPTPGAGRNYTKFGKKLMISNWDKYCPGTV